MRCQALHDALHIHHHRLHRARAMAISWLRKLPAGGMPWRMSTSLAVQQMPARLIPLAPLLAAYSSSSGSVEAATIISDRVGSWPWTTMLT
jgi:hypothetical protein